MVATYVANIDGLASLGTGSSVVSERVWWSRRTASGRAAIKSAVWRATEAASEASTASEATAESAASAEGWTTATSKAATEATTGTAKASAWWEVVGKAVLADLKVASLPIVPIKLLNSIASVVWRLESNNTGALWSSIWADVDISADHSTLTSWVMVSLASSKVTDCMLTSLTEKILQILPSNSVWKL